MLQCAVNGNESSPLQGSNYRGSKYDIPKNQSERNSILSTSVAFFCSDIYEVKIVVYQSTFSTKLKWSEKIFSNYIYVVFLRIKHFPYLLQVEPNMILQGLYLV